jgi:hypothetical protein
MSNILQVHHYSEDNQSFISDVSFVKTIAIGFEAHQVIYPFYIFVKVLLHIR